MTAPDVRPAPDDPDAVPRPVPDPSGPDLLRRRPVARLLRSRWYPGVFQVPVAAVFGLVAYVLLAGPETAHHNAGTALLWVVWWPLLPLAFLLAGRFWCAVCPFGAITDAVRKVVGLERPVPRFLKRYGIWLIDAQFLLITWADHVWGVVGSPWGSGVLLLLLTTGVVASGAFLQRRAFCRYLCFLGGLCSTYGRTGVLDLRADRAVCAGCTARAACYHGTATVDPCPLSTFPRTMDSSAHCSFCGNCVKSCPNDAIRLRLRPPTSQLWSVRTPRVEESFLAMAIMGIVLVQNVTMLGVWTDLLDLMARAGVTAPVGAFTIAFAVAVAVPVALLLAASAVAARRTVESVTANFARFGYALIPLDVAAHLAHNLFHLLSEGGHVTGTVAAVFGFPVESSAALAGAGTIRVLQYALLAAGAAGSVHALRRLAGHRYRTAERRRATTAPYLVMIVLLAAVNAYLFTQPMTHRM